MTNCPRCKHPVDERVRATCPICFAALPGAGPELDLTPRPASGPGSAMPPGNPPQSAAYSQPPPVGMPGYAPPGTVPPPARPGRVSLTGEVIEDTRTSPVPPAYGAPAYAPVPQAPPPGGYRPGYGPTASSNSSARKGAIFGGGAAGVYIVIRIILLIARIFVHTTPSSSAAQAYTPSYTPPTHTSTPAPSFTVPGTRTVPVYTPPAMPSGPQTLPSHAPNFPSGMGPNTAPHFGPGSFPQGTRFGPGPRFGPGMGGTSGSMGGRSGF